MNTRTHRPQDADLTSYWTLRRIGAAVTIRRLEIELDPTGLAALVGVPADTIEAIEEGRYDPRVVLAPRLETALAMVPGTIEQLNPNGTDPLTSRTTDGKERRRRPH